MNDRPVALVTGASRGIGRAVALALGRNGFDIAAVARPHPKSDARCGLETLGQEIEASGRRFVHAHADVADLGGHEAILSTIHERFGRLDVLVCNAGVAPDPRRDVLDMTPESFDRVLAVNLRGAVFLAQKVARRMLEQAGTTRGFTPVIVFITSVSAERSSVNRAEYCVSKAGLSMAARVLADRLAAHGVRVFEVRPGIIRTDMTRAAKAKYDRLVAEGLVPQARWGEPEDVARAVAALVGGDFDYSTGMIIDVGGGLSIPRLE
jgi:NAD(P)-dependent dehydrogenase (short-subunit alcohol dehydrogenase family)